MAAQYLQKNYSARTFINGTVDPDTETYPGEAKDIQTLLAWLSQGCEVLELIWARVELCQDMLDAGILPEIDQQDKVIHWVGSMCQVFGRIPERS